MNIIVGAFCFLVMAILAGRHVGSGWVPGLLFGVVGLLLAAGFVTGLWALLQAVNGSVRDRVGAGALTTASSRGLLLMVPFATLALLAELALGWNAVQPFLTAGSMTAAGLAGAEAMRLGGGRLRNSVLPALAALAFSSLWLAAGAIISAAGR